MNYLYIGFILCLALVVGAQWGMLKSSDKKLQEQIKVASTCAADLDTANQINNQNAEEYAKLATAKTLADIEAASVIANSQREAAILRDKILEISNGKGDGPIPPNLQSTLDWVRQNAAAHH